MNGRGREEMVMSKAGSHLAFTAALVVVVRLTYAAPAVSAPRWVEEGPGPILNGQTQGIPNNPVAGAINAIVASQINPDLLYVRTVNGGVWKTTNATADSPRWTRLTDRKLPGLSIISLAVSPVNSRILFAGTGSTSSFAFDGSPGFGVARSNDGGRTWTVLAEDTFAGRRINSIVPTALDGGNVVLAATWRDVPPGKPMTAWLEREACSEAPTWARDLSGYPEMDLRDCPTRMLRVWSRIPVTPTAFTPRCPERFAAPPAEKGCTGTGQTLFQFDGVDFYQPFTLNSIDPSRVLIAHSNIYESLDRGDSLANLGSTVFIFGNGLGAGPVAYGGRLAGVLYRDAFYLGLAPQFCTA